MFACLARIVLSGVCFPLLGAYGLRWLGTLVQEVWVSLGTRPVPAVAFLDLLGSVLGVVAGLVMALVLVASGCQRRNSGVQAAADLSLLVLVLTFLADVVVPAMVPAGGTGELLAPISLVVWMATGAAAVRLSRLRRAAARIRSDERRATVG